MTVTLSRWGNSLAVRIPKGALKEAGWHEGDILEVVSEPGQLVLKPQGAPPSLDDLIARITPDNVHVAIFDTVRNTEAW